MRCVDAPNHWRTDDGNTLGGRLSTRSYLAVPRFIRPCLASTSDALHVTLALWRAARRVVRPLDGRTILPISKCPPVTAAGPPQPVWFAVAEVGPTVLVTAESDTAVRA